MTTKEKIEEAKSTGYFDGRKVIGWVKTDLGYLPDFEEPHTWQICLAENPISRIIWLPF